MITTFNTPIGRYRWKRLPFGISSAPEVFQRRMHLLVEGLSGVEVIADDFVVVGFGDSIWRMQSRTMIETCADYFNTVNRSMCI